MRSLAAECIHVLHGLVLSKSPCQKLKKRCFVFVMDCFSSLMPDDIYTTCGSERYADDEAKFAVGCEPPALNADFCGKKIKLTLWVCRGGGGYICLARTFGNIQANSFRWELPQYKCSFPISVGETRLTNKRAKYIWQWNGKVIKLWKPCVHSKP